jgi:hypothetical protein
MERDAYDRSSESVTGTNLRHHRTIAGDYTSILRIEDKFFSQNALWTPILVHGLRWCENPSCAFNVQFEHVGTRIK